MTRVLKLFIEEEFVHNKRYVKLWLLEKALLVLLFGMILFLLYILLYF